jgi:hypothetical protein
MDGTDQRCFRCTEFRQQGWMENRGECRANYFVELALNSAVTNVPPPLEVLAVGLVC